MKFQFNDGGRARAGYKGLTGDCTVRAIAIATGKPYQEVYDQLFEINRVVNKDPKRATPRAGYTKMKTTRKFLEQLGWQWVPMMRIGQGCKTHLRASELPSGRIICRVSKHLVAVVDGVINDAYDCSRRGTRCVYGYFKESSDEGI